MLLDFQLHVQVNPYVHVHIYIIIHVHIIVHVHIEKGKGKDLIENIKS